MDPVEILDITDDLTAPILGDRLEAAKAEMKGLIDRANEGDKSLKVSSRVRELSEYVTDLGKAKASIESTVFEVPEDPAPVAPVAVEEDETEEAPAEDAAPVETPTDPPADAAVTEPAPVAETETDGGEAVLTDANAIIAAALADPAIAEAVAAGVGVTETIPESEVEVLDPENSIGGAPVFASAPDGQGGRVTGDRINMPFVTSTVRNADAGWAHMNPAQRVDLFRVNRAPQGIDEQHYVGGQGADNQELIYRRDNLPQSVQAAAVSGLGICGDPVKVQVADCPLDNSTPFLDALVGNVAPARACKIEVELPLGYQDIDPGPDFWTICQQDGVDDGNGNIVGGVDPNDRSTWKPIAAVLPECPDKCVFEPNLITMGLEVTTLQELCQPQAIDRATRIIDCLLAVRLETFAMTRFDTAIGADHHFPFDATETTLGAKAALELALCHLTAGFSTDRKAGVAPGGLWAAMHPSIINTIKADMLLAGEQASQVNSAVSDMFAAAGISRIVFTKDWGTCEGEMFGSLAPNDVDCSIGNCDVPDLAANCVPFGAGTGVLPGLPDKSRIRVFNPNSWFGGSDFLIDFALRKSPEMLRQNRGEMFGELIMHLFKASNCGDFEATLDVSGLCATGQRVRSMAEVPCPVPGTQIILGAAAPGGALPGGAGDLVDPGVPAAGSAPKTNTTDTKADTASADGKKADADNDKKAA